MNFFKHQKPGPKSAEIWNADPLVIADVNGEIVFAAHVDIEVIPLDGAKYGMRTLVEGGVSRWLNEAEEFQAPEAGIYGFGATALGTGRRGVHAGRFYAGVDETGSDSYWYFGSAAEAYIRTQNQPEAEL